MRVCVLLISLTLVRRRRRRRVPGQELRKASAAAMATRMGRGAHTKLQITNEAHPAQRRSALANLCAHTHTHRTPKTHANRVMCANSQNTKYCRREYNRRVRRVRAYLSKCKLCWAAPRRRLSVVLILCICLYVSCARSLSFWAPLKCRSAYQIYVYTINRARFPV